MKGGRMTREPYTEVRNILYRPTHEINEDENSLDLYVPCHLTQPCMDCVHSDIQRTSVALFDCDKNRRLHNFGGKCHTLNHDLCQSSDLEQTPLPPLVVFVHGGGWQRGGRIAWMHFMRTPNLLVALITWFMGLYRNVGVALASRGVACAVISYPLANLQMPWRLLDIFLSYCCNLVISVPCFILLSFLLGLNYGRSNFLSSVLVFNNLLTVTCVLLLLPRHYFLTKKTHFLMVILTLIILPLLEIYGTALHSQILCSPSFTIYVSLLAYFNRSKPVSYEEQLLAVTSAIKWLKHFGENNTYFDPSALFLMGHSAGGHLVALTALDQRVLAEAGCSSSDIKGVVCISAVFDLLTLSSPISSHLYLHPAFGPRPETWTRASPVWTLDKAIDSYCPPFLIINAEFDGFFKTDGDNFYNQLKRRNMNAIKSTAKGTTHFTIMAYFSVNVKSELSNRCVDFIRTQWEKNKESSKQPLT